MARVAIQVLTYFRSKQLERLLQYLKAQTFSDWELFVWDNSCDENERTAVSRLLMESGVPYHLTVNDSNNGFTAHNELFKQHCSEFVFILNDDAWLEPDYLNQCVRRMENDQACAAVTGLIYRSGTDKVIDTAGLRYHCLGYVVDRFAGGQYAFHQPEKIFGASCTAVLFRRSALEAVSPERVPFDPGFFMYKEDVDLAIRLQRKGFTAWLEPAAIAWHERGLKETGKGWRSRIGDERKRSLKLRVQTYKNQWAIYAYHFSWGLGFADIFKTLWHELKRSAALFVFASPMVFFHTWREIHRHWSEWKKRRVNLEALGLKRIRL